jgi:transposase
MKKEILHVGIDVDDQAFHVTAFLKDTGEVVEDKCKPTVKSLQRKLESLGERFPEFKIKTCYEATYIGFTLQRELSVIGFDCAVVAPSSIPRVHGNQVKTDRVDAGKLAQFYSAGILTFVTVPEKETESDRDLIQGHRVQSEERAL